MFDEIQDGRDIHFSSDNDYCYWYLLLLILVLSSSSAGRGWVEQEFQENTGVPSSHTSDLGFHKEIYRARSELHLESSRR